MNRFVFSRRPVLGLVVGLALIAAALPATTAAQEASAGVNFIEPSATDPMSWGMDNPNLTVPVGQTVVWTNTGAQPHTVTADDGSIDSGMLAPGETFSYTFTTPGTFTYHCAPHPWMTATVTVTGS